MKSLVTIAIIALAAAIPLRAQDFYDQQLRAGQTDAAAGRLVQAADELRIAAFGFLDRPPFLTTALVQLALVQNSLGNTAAVTQTLDRFLEVERRFSAYSTAQIDDKTRSAFETLLLKSEPRSALIGINSLAKLIRTDAEKVADLPVDKRAGAYEEGFRKSSHDISWALAAARDAASRGADEDVVRWSRRALSVDNANIDARALLAHAETRRGNCRDALRDLAVFSPSALQLRSDLAGDQVVCLVTESKWTDAETAAAKLPAAVQQRPDVARALQTLSGHRTRPAPTSATASGPAGTSPRTMTPSTPPQKNPARSATESTVPDRGDARTTQNPAKSPADETRATQSPANGAVDSARPSQTTPSAATSAPQVPTRATAMKSAEILSTSRTLIEGGKFADAAHLLQPAVANDPTNRQLRLSLLEAGVLAREYPLAVSQVSYVSPFSDGEEVSMFYAAAALFEAGRKAEAIPLLQRARPRLTPSPLVDYYAKAILGPSLTK